MFSSIGHFWTEFNLQPLLYYYCAILSNLYHREKTNHKRVYKIVTILLSVLHNIVNMNAPQQESRKGTPHGQE